MRRLNLRTTLFAVAATVATKLYGKRLLRSHSVCDSSDCYLKAEGGFGKTSERPAELSALEHVAALTCESAASGGVCHVYLIGTHHGSQKSCKEVKAAIEFVKPEVVFMELCLGHTDFLKEVEGGEFYVAYLEAIKYGAKVILGDRPLDITVRRFPIVAYLKERLVSHLKVIRIIVKMHFEKEALAASNLAHELEHEINEEASTFYETMIYERDQYMSATLLNVGRKHNSVVVVVGSNHLPGIEKHWEQPVDMEQLLRAPTRNTISMIIRYIIIFFV